MAAENKPTGYMIKVGDKYIKRTSNFGHFYGSVTFTEDIRQAKVWSRKKDACYKAGVVRDRIKEKWRKSYKKMDPESRVQVVPERL